MIILFLQLITSGAVISQSADQEDLGRLQVLHFGEGLRLQCPLPIFS